jgi:hypothetical protein
MYLDVCFWVILLGGDWYINLIQPRLSPLILCHNSIRIHHFAVLITNTIHHLGHN